MLEHMDALGKAERVDAKQRRDSRVGAEHAYIIAPAVDIFVLALGGLDHEELDALIGGFVKDAADRVGLTRAGAARDKHVARERILLQKDPHGLLFMHMEYLSQPQTRCRLCSVEGRDVASKGRAFDNG